MLCFIVLYQVAVGLYTSYSLVHLSTQIFKDYSIRSSFTWIVTKLSLEDLRILRLLLIVTTNGGVENSRFYNTPAAISTFLCIVPYKLSNILAKMGLEPTRICIQQILSLSRLPIPPPRHIKLSNINLLLIFNIILNYLTFVKLFAFAIVIITIRFHRSANTFYLELYLYSLFLNLITSSSVSNLTILFFISAA